jgi:ribosomal protein L19
MGLKDSKVNNRFVGGDTVWVRYRDKIGAMRYKNFRGVCLGSTTKQGGEQTIVLRSVVGGVGVEYGFHTSSKMILECKKVSGLVRSGGRLQRGGRVKRYDMRKAS